MRAILRVFLALSLTGAAGCVSAVRHKKVTEGAYRLGYKRASDAAAQLALSLQLKNADLEDQVVQLNAMCNGKNAIPAPRICQPKKRKLGKSKLRGEK